MLDGLLRLERNRKILYLITRETFPVFLILLVSYSIRYQNHVIHSFVLSILLVVLILLLLDTPRRRFQRLDAISCLYFSCLYYFFTVHSVTRTPYIPCFFCNFLTSGFVLFS